MPQSLRFIDPPNISPLRKPIGTSAGQIHTDTYVQITPAAPDHKIYFSTDGDDPDPWHRVIAGDERTFKYRAPFRLREGMRIVRALSVSRRDKASSRVTTKAFDVILPPNSTASGSRYKQKHTHTVIPEERTPTTTEDELSASVLEESSSIITSSTLQDTDMEVSDIIESARDRERGTDGWDTDRQRYRSLLDSTYEAELNQRRRTDTAASTTLMDKYLNNSASSDVDSYFADSYHRTSDVTYGRTLDDAYDYSDGDTQVSNYFRSSRPDTHSWLATRSPTRSLYKAEDPPAFWSTATPRVRFDDTQDICFSDRPHTSASLRSEGDRLQQPRSARQYSSDLDRKYKDDYSRAPLSRQSVSDNYSSTRVRLGAPNVSRAGRRTPSPVEVGYHAGFDMGRDEVTGSDTDTYVVDSSPRRRRRSARKSKFQEVLMDLDNEESNSCVEDEQKKEENSEGVTQNDADNNKLKEDEDKNLADKDKDEDEAEKKKAKKDKDKNDKDNEEKKKKDEKANESEEEEKKDKKKKKKKKDDGSDDDKKKEKKKKKKKKDSDSDSDSSDDDKKKKKKKNKDKEKSVAGPRTQTRTMETKEGALSFVNDSGTQINFWGTPPDEVVKKVVGAIPNGPKAGGHDNSRQMKATQNNSRPMLAYPPKDAIAYPPYSSRSVPVGQPVMDDPAAGPIVSTQTQQEQHSVSGFFRKLFGMDKKKDKKKQGEATVREADHSKDGQKEAEARYDALRQKCLDSGSLWEDPDFPAIDEAVYTKESPVDGPIEWKRPHEICDDPQMFVGGASRFDVKQGVLGNCWLLAAVASLTTNEKLLHKVIPPTQSFSDKYAGVFRFMIWQYGQWVEVCIDDRLPTSNGELVFMHSEEGNEFWSPLLEKAYAKLCGSYENLSGGLASEAMTDFTGGVTERFNFREELPDNMFSMMLKAYQRKSLMGCSIDASPDQIEEELDNGLIIGHAYSITAVKVLSLEDGDEQLVRVRNPWGNDCEWTGAWSDQSEEWADVPEDVKESMGLNFDHDGEFWMSFKDFSTHFQRLEICHLSPDSLGSDDGSTMWTSRQLNGAWKKNVTAGGCRNFTKTYYTNPQFRIQITDADDDDEEDIGTIIVGLMQKGRRKLRTDGAGNLTMGYEIFQTDGKSSKNTLDRSFFKSHKPAATSAYINMREVCTRHRMPPGDYCIIVTTFEPGEEADFVLRIYSEKPGSVAEMDADTGVVQVQNQSMTQSAPHPGLMKQAEQQFQMYGGDDEEIDAYELQSVLNAVLTKDFDFSGFDLNLCRSLLAMKDLDHTGKLALDEFKEMWKQLNHWKNVFKKYDEDKSGSFNTSELREALKHCGYQVSNAAFHSVVMRFSDKDGNLRFDDFVACVVKLSTLFSIYTNQFQDGNAAITLDNFVQKTIYS